MPVHFYYGDEDYNIEREIAKKKSALDKNFITMNFKSADNPNFADLISILRTQPMMFGRVLIVIKCLSYFSKSFEEDELKELEKTLNEVSDDVDIIFTAVLPRQENKKIDSRRKVFKILASHNSREFLQFRTYEVKKISNRINSEAKSKDISLDSEAVLALIEQIGNNLREFDKELDKLKLLAYPDKKITKKMVQEICISNEDLFVFTDFIMKGDKGLALLELKKLFIKKYPLEILSTLQTMIHRWILIKLKSKTHSVLEISKLVGKPEFVVENNIKDMKNHSLKDLVRLKQNLTNAEYKIKSGESVDIEGEIENAIMR